MKNVLLYFCLLGAVLSVSCTNYADKKVATAQKPTPATQSQGPLTIPTSQQTLLDMQKVANWQIPRLTHLDYIGSARSKSADPKEWIQATFLTGLTELANRSVNPYYENWIGMTGTREKWNLGIQPYFADDHLAGQTWIWYYLRNKKADEMIAPTRKAFDDILRNPPTNSLDFTDEMHPDLFIEACQLRWCWADALFMSPPTWFALSKATGDMRYADYANKEFKATVAKLYSEELHLMYRDSRFFNQKGAHGEPIFWARGTGWVFGGLVRILDYMPKDYVDRPFYEKLYREMAAKLITLQKKDGSWPTSLLAGEAMPEPETSGTGFFTYGLAWGIKNGILAEETYLQPVLRGWAVLTSAVHPDGKLGWVQPVGAAPDKVTADDSHLYGTGAYLLAGAMIYDLAHTKEIAALKNKREAYGRYVPERLDDYAWENDKVVYRIYGPNNNVPGTVASGIDGWLKKVKYPVINKWYEEHLTKQKSYHDDIGEGNDPFHTGPSRGIGGAAIWLDGKAYPAPAFRSAVTLLNTKEEIRFQANYKWHTPLGVVTEKKTFSLKLGSQLTKITSQYTLNGKPSKLPIAIGVTTHDEKAKVMQNAKTGRISAWEVIENYGVGTGAIIAPEKVKSIVHIPSSTKDQSHIWMITETDDAGEITYYSGLAWEAAGDITTVAAWNNYLDTFVKEAK